MPSGRPKGGKNNYHSKEEKIKIVKEMLENNDKQQEERQFYEMLKIQKDNIDKLTMDARINTKDIPVNGTSAIRLLQIEFTNIHTLTLFNYEKNGQNISQAERNEYFKIKKKKGT